MVPARASIHNAYCVRRWLNPFDNARRLPISGAPISGVPQLRPFACLSSMVEGRRLCQMLCFTTRYLLICVVRVSGVVKKSRFFPPSPLPSLPPEHQICIFCNHTYGTPERPLRRPADHKQMAGRIAARRTARRRRIARECSR